jgi:glutamine amidotransferase
MIGIVDYGMGNLRSVEKAFETVGHAAQIIRTPQAIADSDKLVLPGVGAFGSAMENLCRMDLLEPLSAAVADGKPLLGICLGLQLLFEESEEHGLHEGLGVFEGRVRRLPEGVKVPHIGWNQVSVTRDDPLLQGIPDNAFFYFVQSYFVEPQDQQNVIGKTDYGVTFTSIVGWRNVYGVQFHPEKSQDAGLKLLKNFGDLRC